MCIQRTENVARSGLSQKLLMLRIQMHHLLFCRQKCSELLHHFLQGQHGIIHLGCFGPELGLLFN